MPTLSSPSHIVIGHNRVDEHVEFFGAFGFEVVARGTLDAATAAALYDLDQEVDEVHIAVPGAERGWIRLVETPHPSVERSAFEPKPLAVDLYTRELEKSIEIGKSLGGKPHELVEYDVGPLSIREVEIEGPGNLVLVLLQVSQRRSSVLDLDESRLHSEVHSVVWAVPDAESAITEMRDRGGLTVLSDAEIRGDTISRLMNLPKPEVPVRFVLLCDEDITPTRLEFIEFFEDHEPAGDPWLPLRPGLLGPCFSVDDLDAAMAALSGCTFRAPVTVENACHRQARAVSGEGPGGFLFELWQE